MPEETCILTDDEEKELSKKITELDKADIGLADFIVFINKLIDEAWVKGRSSGC